MKYIRLIKSPLRLLWFLLLVCGFLGCFLGLVEAPKSSFLIILVLNSILSFYLSMRMLTFWKRLVQYFRHLLSGDYSVGIKHIKGLSDEIAYVTFLANRVSTQLRIYDELRNEKTGFSYRGFDFLFRSVNQPLVIASVEKKQFKLNPIAQVLLDYSDDTIDFDSMECIQENTGLFEALNRAVNIEKNRQKALVSIAVSLRHTPQQYSLIIHPMKNNAEEVKMAIIFIEQVQPE